MIKELREKLQEKELQLLKEKGYIKPTLERDLDIYTCYQKLLKRFSSSYAVANTACRFHVSMQHVYRIVQRLKIV